MLYMNKRCQSSVPDVMTLWNGAKYLLKIFGNQSSRRNFHLIFHLVSKLNYSVTISLKPFKFSPRFQVKKNGRAELFLFHCCLLKPWGNQKSLNNSTFSFICDFIILASLRLVYVSCLASCETNSLIGHWNEARFNYYLSSFTY